MSTLKTLPTTASPVDFLNTLDDDVKKADSLTLLKLFEKATGEKPRMWGSSIIGFGMYHYKSERSTQEGDWPLVGFSPRKQALTLYIMPNVSYVSDMFPKLGKYNISGGSCLYIKKLADVEMKVLEEIIRKSFNYAKKTLVK